MHEFTGIQKVGRLATAYTLHLRNFPFPPLSYPFFPFFFNDTKISKNVIPDLNFSICEKYLLSLSFLIVKFLELDKRNKVETCWTESPDHPNQKLFDFSGKQTETSLSKEQK